MPESNLHITLAFMGSVTETRVPELSTIAARAAVASPGDAGPLAITFEGFEYWAKPQVLAVLEHPHDTRAEQASSVGWLARTLVTETAAAGFSPDLKPFRAHVTVARKVTRAPRPGEMRRVLWSFDSFALIESRTLPEGPVYSVVESFVLGSADKMCT